MQPVDLTLFPDYLKKCPTPMDFQSIGDKLESGDYTTPFEFADDVKLTFNNAIAYNGKVKERKWVATSARYMLSLFNKTWKASRVSKWKPPVPKSTMAPLPAPVHHDEDGLNGEEGEGEILTIHKILGRKMDEDPEDPTRRCQWFLVKWKDKSYLHTSFELESDLTAVDPEAKRKINKFLATDPVLHDASKLNGSLDLDDDGIEFFPTEYTEVHTILSCNHPSPKPLLRC